MTAVAPEKPGKVKAFLRLVMIEHSVFALPFAYLSALVAIDRDEINEIAYLGQGVPRTATARRCRPRRSGTPASSAACDTKVTLVAFIAAPNAPNIGR